MRKLLILSFCAVALTAFVCSTIVAEDNIPGTPDPNMGSADFPSEIRDLNTTFDVFGENDWGRQRIAVGAGGELNFKANSKTTITQMNPETGVYTFNGGKTTMEEGSSLTTTKVVVGASDPGGRSKIGTENEYNRKTFSNSEGTFNATGAYIDATQVTIQKNGEMNLVDSTVTNTYIAPVPDPNAFPDGIRPELNGGTTNSGGTINAKNTTFNLGSGRFTNGGSPEHDQDKAIANIKGGAINGNVTNTNESSFNTNGTIITGQTDNSNSSTFTAENTKFTGTYDASTGYVHAFTNSNGSTFKAKDSSFSGVVANQNGSTMSLTGSTVTGEVWSFAGENKLYVDDTKIQSGRAVISNELHVGSGGLNMSGGYAMFYNNNIYNPGSESLTTLYLTLTDDILNNMLSSYNETLGVWSFFLSDFITESAFYWYGADGKQQNWIDSYWRGFEFIFDLDELTEADRWIGIFEDNGLDLKNGNSFAFTTYDIGAKKWETGNAYDVRFSISEINDPLSSDTPEPATLAILGFGALGAGLYRRSRSKHTKA